MSKKHKKVCITLNYIKYILTLACKVTGCISISAFASLFCISMRITNSAIGLKVCAKAARIEMYKSIIKKKKNKHDKIALSAKSELNSLEVLISKALIDSVISQDEFVLINNVLKEYDKMKEEIKRLQT